MAAPKKRIAIVAGVIVLAAAAVALALPGGPLGKLLFRSGRGAGDTVRVSGNIETTTAEVSFKIPGRVLTRPVDEGDFVHAGDLVATLETADLQCTGALRRAEREAARAQLDELEAGSRPEEKDAALAAMQKAYFNAEELVVGSRPQQIGAGRAEYEAARAEADRLERELGRAQKLFGTGVVSQEDLDRARTAYEVAARRMRQAAEQLSMLNEGSRVQQIDQALAALDQATAQYDLVMAGPRIEDIQQGRARLAQAEAALKLAETQLGYARLAAPLTGVVLSKQAEPGEYVAPGTPVVTVGDLEHVWLRAYITAVDLPRVKVGQKARITTDGLTGSYEGRVSFIASKAEFTPKNVQTEKERVKLVYRIKIDIENLKMELKPGMPADAEIEVGP